jgi:hypothetical protein
MFELNFGDERYLPFEGAGAISKWGLSFPAGCDQFDMSSVSDVILHIKYTALHEGYLGVKAKDALEIIWPQNGSMIFSLKHRCPTQWEQAINEGTMDFSLGTEHFPFYLRGKAEGMKVLSAELMLVTKEAGMSNKIITLNNGVGTLNFNLAKEEPLPFGEVYIYKASATSTLEAKGNWTVDFGSDSNKIDPADVEDIIIGLGLGTQTANNN